MGEIGGGGDSTRVAFGTGLVEIRGVVREQMIVEVVECQTQLIVTAVL